MPQSSMTLRGVRIETVVTGGQGTAECQLAVRLLRFSADPETFSSSLYSLRKRAIEMFRIGIIPLTVRCCWLRVVVTSEHHRQVGAAPLARLRGAGQATYVGRRKTFCQLLPTGGFTDPQVSQPPVNCDCKSVIATLLSPAVVPWTHTCSVQTML